MKKRRLLSVLLLLATSYSTHAAYEIDRLPFEVGTHLRCTQNGIGETKNPSNGGHSFSHFYTSTRYGLDFGWEKDVGDSNGIPIVAAKSGYAVYIPGYQNSGFGNRVLIYHGPYPIRPPFDAKGQPQDRGPFTLYAHLKSSPFGKDGQKVNEYGDDRWVDAGEIIGYMGNTGFGTGTHLHFGVQKFNPSGGTSVSKIDGRSIPMQVTTTEYTRDGDFLRHGTFITGEEEEVIDGPPGKRSGMFCQHESRFESRIKTAAEKRMNQKWSSEEWPTGVYKEHRYAAYAYSSSAFEIVCSSSARSASEVVCWLGPLDDFENCESDSISFRMVFEYGSYEWSFADESMCPQIGGSVTGISIETMSFNGTEAATSFGTFTKKGSSDAGGQNPPPQNSDLHIDRFRGKINGTSGHGYNVNVPIQCGQNIRINGALDIKNKGNVNAYGLKSEYHVSNERRFKKTNPVVDRDKAFDLGAGVEVEKSSSFWIHHRADCSRIDVYSDDDGQVANYIMNTDGTLKLYISVSVDWPGGDSVISKEDSNSDGYYRLLIESKGLPPLAPKGRMTKMDCNALEGEVRDSNSNGPLWIHIYRNGLHYHSIYANQSVGNGNYRFSYPIPNHSRDGRWYTWRAYVLDDRVNGYAGNPRIGSDKRQRCYPAHASWLHRARSNHSNSYFHTRSAAEHQSLRNNRDWSVEGPDFVAFSRWVPGTRPIYYLWHHGRRSHLHSHSSREGVSIGYRYDRLAFYCYTSQRPGTVPLWRMYNPHKQSHRIAESGDVRGSERQGFRKEAVMCYVYPS